MKRKLLVLLAMCAFTIAMMPTERRAVNTEEEKELKKVPNKEVCDHQTPCAWYVYTPPSRAITLNITNSYCVCAVGTICHEYEDDTSVSAFVYRCQAPRDDEDTDESDS